MEDLTLFSISASKARLGELIRRAQGGEGIAVTNNGTPAVVLVPVATYVSLFESHDRESLKRSAP